MSPKLSFNKSNKNPALPADDLPSQVRLIQAPPEQVMLYKTPSSHIKTIFQETTSTQTTSQDMAYEFLSAQAIPFYSMQSPKIRQLSQDLESQNIQYQTKQSSEILYKDIQTEVMEQSQEWKPRGNYPRRFSWFRKNKDGKYPKRYSLDLTRKGKPSSRRYSLDLQTKGGQSLRRKSLDQKIKAWLSAKSQFLSKQAQYNQTTEQIPQQPFKDLQAKGEQSLKEKSKDREDKEQQIIKEPFPKKQTQDKQAEDQQAQEEKSPKEQPQSWQAKSPQVQMKKALKQLCQDWDSLSQEQEDGQFTPKKSLQWTKQNWPCFQQSEDWINQRWRNKDWVARDWQSEMQHALNRKTRDLLEKEALKQNTMAQYSLDRRSPDKDQKEFQSRVALKEDMQKRHIKKGKLQPEDTSPNYQPSSSQSLVHDTYVTCWSNIDSEPEVQQYASTSSNSYRDLNVTSSSCSKDPQQSEDSD
uniref:Uncharacterized protein n=1 Tax=Sciurus vulgaris TaxID=55149 RepID=A0A8D2JEY8_SCIVU